MDRYDLVEFPMNRWLDRDLFEASGGGRKQRHRRDGAPRAGEHVG